MTYFCLVVLLWKLSKLLKYYFKSFSSVQSLSRVPLFTTPWTAAHQASLSITDSWNLLELMSIESVMPSNHLILCCPLLLLPLIFPSIRVFSSGSALCIRWPNYWSFCFSNCPSNEYIFGGPLFFLLEWVIQFFCILTNIWCFHYFLF